MIKKRKSLPAGYEINPVTGRRRKSCRPDQVRNPQTNKCKKIRSKSKRKSLPAGYEINPATGRRRKSCRPDQFRDPQTNKCKKIRAKSKKRKSLSPKKVAMDECPVCLNDTDTRTSTCNHPGCNHPLCDECFNNMIASGRIVAYSNNGTSLMACPLCRGHFSSLSNSPIKRKSPINVNRPGNSASNPPLRAKSPLKRKSPIKRRILFSAPVPFQYGECTVCHEETAFKIPGCNHYLCRSCYNGMRLSGRTMNCPLCRNRITHLT